MDYTELICPICGQKSFSTFEKISDIAYCTNCHSNSKKSICFLWQKGIDQEELDRLGAYIFHNSIDSGFICYGDKEYKILKDKNFEDIVQLSKEMVDAWYPRTFAQKIDYILLYLQKHLKMIGDDVNINIGAARGVFFVELKDVIDSEVYLNIESQTEYYLDYLRKEEYLDYEKDYNFPFVDYYDNISIKLLPKALARVDELQKDINNNKDIFVAMAFNDDTKPTREAIRKAIQEAKFSDKFIDEIIHNQQIVPYMMRLIRDCRFLIMDITEPNYGAYYEAGYALGLGKEVIITCRQDIFSKKIYKDELEEKALKPHFDILQKQILVWKDEKDLSAKLKQWILELATRKR